MKFSFKADTVDLLLLATIAHFCIYGVSLLCRHVRQLYPSNWTVNFHNFSQHNHNKKITHNINNE